MKTKEVYTNDICLSCSVRAAKLKELERDGTGIQECRCIKSKYYAWVVDSVMEGKNE